MSLDLTQSLGSLAMGQAMLVAPTLGESYTGKTAGSIAFLLFMLANGLEDRLARREAFARRLESLLAAARVDAAKVRDIRCKVLGDPTEHRCDWRQKTAEGRWEAWSVILARDGGRWILIDTPGRASRP
jgi:hypothetical protein